MLLASKIESQPIVFLVGIDKSKAEIKPGDISCGMLFLPADARLRRLRARLIEIDLY